MRISDWSSDGGSSDLVRDLSFARNETRVFGPLDFDVAAGEALLVQGDNGAGKTTLLRVLAGLLAVETGSIAIHGQLTSPASRAATLAHLGHLPALKADLSALEKLDFLCGLQDRTSTRLNSIH